MKKIFTLAFAAFIAFTASAAARPPKVVLKTSANYDVRIDGRMYRADDLTLRNLSSGMHTVEVYKVGGGFFGKRKALVSMDKFMLRNNDVTIDVNQWGRTKISEDRFGDRGGWGNNNRGNGGYSQSQYPNQQQYPSQQQYPRP